MAKETKEERILESAMKLFSEQGYHNTTISQIANRADVAKGTVYWYFDSKEDLFQAILLTGINNLSEVMEKRVEEEDEVIEKLKIVIEIIFDFFKQGREIAKMFWESQIAFKKDFKERIMKFNREEIKFIAGIIDEAKEEGIIQEELDAIDASHIFMGMISSFNPNLYHDENGDIVDKADVLLDVFLNGIRG